MRYRVCLISLVLLGIARTHGAVNESPRTIDWLPWSDAVFAQAKRENKFVLLDLHAVWCHWCHVMDEKTYRDRAVIELIRSRYLAVSVDQESRPDIANRYEDYGWPATVVFAPDGSEIVKRRGYLPPAQMASMLQAIIDDPTPGPSVVPEAAIGYAKEGSLSKELRAELERNFLAGYDTKLGSWGTTQKFLDWDNTEYCLARALATDDARATRMAKQTLDAQRQLIDPIWGGVYQYSTHGDWKHPHFEKIMPVQAENLRVYAQGYALWSDPSHLQAARAIQRYAREFLTSPDGAFYTSQDADLVPGKHSAGYFNLGDAARRMRGVPRVDTHVYARENGWMIAALVELHAATGDPTALADAVRAADWIIAHRALPDGGFRHDENDAAGPFLGDTLAMCRACLALHVATAERRWLERADAAAEFIAAHFGTVENAGFATAATTTATSPPLQPRPQFDENVALARFANLLARYTGNDAHRELALGAMRFLATPEIARRRRAFVGGALLADDELASEPLHVTVVGAKDDPAARALFAAGLHYPGAYKQVEWWDRRENPDAPPGGIPFPEFPEAAAFLCASRSCSPPITRPEELREKMRRRVRATSTAAR